MSAPLSLIALFFLATWLTSLEVGNVAPPLDGVTWVKGKAPEVTGMITVVEFWATWCPPCRTTIPYLSLLQQRYGTKVHVIGISIEDRSTVEPFVAQMGDQMCYRVGIAPTAVYASWMDKRGSIPCAFLIDAQGNVVCIGHPMSIEKPLQHVVDGTYDATMQHISVLHKQLKTSTDSHTTLNIIDKLLSIDPLDSEAIQARLTYAASIQNDTLIRDTLAALPVNRMPANMANNLAWDLANDDNLGRRNLDLALIFIGRALELEPKDGAYLATMARVLYGIGMIEEAITYQEKAMSISSNDADMNKALRYYRELLRVRSNRTPSPPTGTHSP